MMDKMLFRVDEAARLIGLGRSKTYEMVASGELPVVRIGRAVRVPAQALEAWIAERTEEPRTESEPRTRETHSRPRSPGQRPGRVARNDCRTVERKGGKHRGR